VTALYDQVYSLFRPYLKNPRRSVWQRYVYEQSNQRQQRDAYWTHVTQFGFHLLFAAFAIAIGQWSSLLL
jgi:sarcosine oxidase delta subunit